MLKAAPQTPLRPAQRPSRPPSRERLISRAEVAQHHSRDDGWIIVDGIVYDITNFANNHPGWTEGGMTSTALSVARALGTDCTEEFHELHTPGQLRTLQSYAIGRLRDDDGVFEALPPALLRSICLCLDAASVARAAAAGGGLARHVATYGVADGGSTCYLPLGSVARRVIFGVYPFGARKQPGFRSEDASVPGLAIHGPAVVAAARFMSGPRSVTIDQPLPPGYLLEFERFPTPAIKPLELDFGLVARVGDRVIEWLYDGAGKAAHRDRSDAGEVSFAYGRRTGGGDTVGVYRRGAAVGFTLNGHDLGEAFGDVPRTARPFVRFPQGGVKEPYGVRFVCEPQCRVVSRAPPPPSDGRLVVQQFGPELDDYMSLKVAETATVRTLRRIVACVLTSRGAKSGGATVAPGDVDIHLLPVVPETPTAQSGDGFRLPTFLQQARGCARHGVVDAADLDRTLRDFGICFYASGVQSRPVYCNLVRDIS